MDHFLALLSAFKGLPASEPEVLSSRLILRKTAAGRRTLSQEERKRVRADRDRIVCRRFAPE